MKTVSQSHIMLLYTQYSIFYNFFIMIIIFSVILQSAHIIIIISSIKMISNLCRLKTFVVEALFIKFKNKKVIVKIFINLIH